MEPVSGQELKMRGFEAPRTSRIVSDQVVVVDGPTTGPASSSPATLTEGGLLSLPTNPSANVGANANPLLPIVWGNGEDAKAETFSLPAVLAGWGSLYLGPKPVHPITDNFGGALVVGHTYYNTTEGRQYVFSTAGRWTPVLYPVPSEIRTYFYTFPIDTTQIPPDGQGTPDSNGNILQFDFSLGPQSVYAVNVYINGAQLVNGVDFEVNEGGSIDLAVAFCAGSSVVVQVLSPVETTFVANAVIVDTSQWLFNGIEDTFPLEDLSGNPLTPGSSANCIVSLNGVVQNPAAYTTVAGTIIFADAPLPATVAWATVGLPATGSKIQALSPADYGGAGDGVADDTAAMIIALNEMKRTGLTLDLSNGTWRVTDALPPLDKASIVSNGSGEIYVDWDADGPILNIEVPTNGEWPVTAITTASYDFAGVESADTQVTRLQLGGTEALPLAGDICKVTANDALVGVEAGDCSGQHIFILATDLVNRYVFIAGGLIDSYTTGMELRRLRRNLVNLRGFGMRANWDRLIPEDWNFSFIQVQGAVNCRADDLRFRDGVQGITFAGCYRNATRGIRGEHFRNATASETPAIPGYVVVDGGCFQPYHNDLGGSDARHIYTTISPDAGSWDKVAWGRTIWTILEGGQAGACSAAAYDTHSDAYEPLFIGLNVFGGYFGEDSAGAGIQFRGVRGTAHNCNVYNCPVGYELYKQFANEVAGHRLNNCSYYGSGTPIRAEHGDDLTGADARQRLRVNGFDGRTTGQIGIDLLDADLILSGSVRILQSGSQTSCRAIFQRAASTVRSEGGRLLHDITGIVGPAQPPRLITFSGPNCSAAGLTAQVIAGATPWQAVVSENDVTPAVAGSFWIDCDCDLPPLSTSGGYSATGSGNLLTAGALLLVLTVNGGRTQATKTGAFALVASHNRQTIVCNGTFTVTVPASTILGSEFHCVLAVVGGTVTIDGPGATNPTIAAGSRAQIVVAGTNVQALVSAYQTL